MKKYLASIGIALALAGALGSDLAAQHYTRNTVLIDTPTAYTIGRGTYQVSFLGYDSGGTELKTFIGLHDNLFLGISFDVQNAIGKEKAKPNVPGVVAKIKFTDGWEAFPISFAIGYDSFYIGQAGKTSNYTNELNRMIYGPYFVITKPVYLLGDEQHFHFGMRLPTQPNYVPRDSSYFLGLDIPMGAYFVFKTEGERIYYNFHRHHDWLMNMGIRYSFIPQLGLEFAVLMQQHQLPNRIVRVEFSDSF